MYWDSVATLNLAIRDAKVIVILQGFWSLPGSNNQGTDIYRGIPQIFYHVSPEPEGHSFRTCNYCIMVHMNRYRVTSTAHSLCKAWLHQGSVLAPTESSLWRCCLERLLCIVIVLRSYVKWKIARDTQINTNRVIVGATMFVMAVNLAVVAVVVVVVAGCGGGDGSLACWCWLTCNVKWWHAWGFQRCWYSPRCRGEK